MEFKRITNPQVSVVITCYNNKEFILKSLENVMAAYNNKKNNIIEVIVVDDASTDKSAEFIQKNFPKIKLIRHKINRGFVATTNTGVRSAVGNIIALLNSDVIPSKDFMVSVIKKFSNPRVFGVSFNETQYSWARGFLRDGYVDHEPGSPTKKVKETFFISGGSSAVRRDYYIGIGGLDEKIFSPFYWEDVDLSYRAQKRGMICYWDPLSIVHHVHGGSVNKISKKYVERIRERNQLLFHWKNLTSPNLIKKHIWGVFDRVRKHPGYIRIVFMAILKLRMVLHARRKEIKESIISDEAILSRFS